MDKIQFYELEFYELLSFILLFKAVASLTRRGVATVCISPFISRSIKLITDCMDFNDHYLSEMTAR